MHNKTTYRNNGAVGALLDEYEKSIIELIHTIENVKKEDLIIIVDTVTDDKDCISIQSILTHVVECGYAYIVEIRKWLGEEVNYTGKLLLNNIEDYKIALRQMFRYNEQLFDDHPTLQICELDNDKKLVTRWGQQFDVEQLIEHAIVHILRHRRQIERFKLIIER